jgi:effector-binding domain-containing protein
MAKISQIMLLHQVAQPALVIESVTDMKDLPQAIGGGFMKIGGYLQQAGETPTDIPFVVYPDFEQMSESRIQVIVGFKTAKSLDAIDGIKAVTLPDRKVVSCLHRGSYAELATLYNEMTGWIKAHGFEAEGTSVEYYYSGPNVPENEQVTRIEMPLKERK